MATFRLRANELAGLTGLSVQLYADGASSIANGAGGDTLTEESTGWFTATVAESLSGRHEYYVYRSGSPIYSGFVVCTGSTWDADVEPPTVTEDTPAVDGALEAAMIGPRKAAGDGVSVEQHSLPDLIAAEKHVAQKAAASSPARGMRFSKIVPGGTVGRLSGE